MIIDIFLPLSLIFIMFTLGLGLTLNDFINLIHTPKAFFVGIMNQMFLLPLVAFIIISLMGITKEIAVGMMILASCPGGVTSNIITKLAKGDTALSISYTAVIIGRLTIVKMLITAVYDIDNAVSPLASLVIIFEVTPPGQDASIIIPTAISFVIPINEIIMNATRGSKNI
jgi:hypothetical protein